MGSAQKIKHKSLVIKIGSSLLTLADGSLHMKALRAYARQISSLINSGYPVVLVSSGAVAAGIRDIKERKKHSPVVRQQLAASLGQVKLMQAYSAAFAEAEIRCAQVLATKADFSGRKHYLNMKQAMMAMLGEGILPIVNENDTVAVEELMFTDNDQLAGLVAGMVDAGLLLLLTNVDGLFDVNPDHPNARLISHLPPDAPDLSKALSGIKSKLGRGGMMSKYLTALNMQQQGLAVVIANGTRSNIILEIIKGNNPPCTRFTPSGKTVSGLKTWLANSDTMVKGQVVINAGAHEALRSKEGKSLLFAGVERIIGDFKRHEVVQVCDDQMNTLGVGRVHFDAITAHKLIGASGERPLIHRNYLYMY